MPTDKPAQYMTSAELEEAIRRHREQTKKLIAEVRSRRAGLSKPLPTPSDNTNSRDTSKK